MPACTVPRDIALEMQAAGMLAPDLKPDSDGQFTVECEAVLAAWCRARAHSYPNESLRAQAFIRVAEGLEAALRLEPPRG